MVLLPLTNWQCTNARVTQLRVLQRGFMSTHVYINARLVYRFGKADKLGFQMSKESDTIAISAVRKPGSKL
jgi:hypothetical protein